MPGMLPHTCNPSWEIEGGGLSSSGYLWLHSRFKASLGYVGPRLKTKQKTKNTFMV